MTTAVIFSLKNLPKTEKTTKMQPNATAALDYVTQNQSAFLEKIFELLRFETVGVDSTKRTEMQRCAAWLVEHFASLGLSAELLGSEEKPLVVARSQPRAGLPTVLIYGHYDVQPAEPLEPWDSPPFEPTITDGKIIARGSTDDKGQLMTHLFAAEAWLKTCGELPVNVVYLLEGQEESGSAILDAFLQEEANLEKLACDVLVVSDCSQLAPGRPAITTGLRGVNCYELTLTGAQNDLHSGSFGGAVTNPGNALSQLLGKVVDAQGRITLPHFYDDVIALTPQEREAFATITEPDDVFFRSAGVTAGNGEAGFSHLERCWARPSFDVNGLTCGYQGEGSKTVLPAVASAKFSFRLVPDQSPEKIEANLRAWLSENCPPGITFSLENQHGSPGMLTSTTSSYYQAAKAAITTGFGVAPEQIRCGGSIPIVSTLVEKLKAPALLLGWGQSDDNTHGPNEYFAIDDFLKGTLSATQLLAELEGCK